MASKKTAAASGKSRLRRRRALCTIAILVLLAPLVLSRAGRPERISDGGFTHSAAFRDHLAVDGIDVSYAQGANIDWKQVKRSGVDFVFIRAGYRSVKDGSLHEDDEFSHNLRDAERAGLMTGVYFYSQAVSRREAREEAEYVLGILDGHALSLPIVMDYEFYPGGRLEQHCNEQRRSARHMTGIAESFCGAIEKAGYESMVYANYDFLCHTLDGRALGRKTKVWMAHYAPESDYPYSYSFWQCSPAARVPGISSEVDRDFMYIRADVVTPSMSRSAEGRTSISECEISLSDENVSTIAFPAKTGVTVKDSGKVLREGHDYLVSFIKNTAPGKGYAVITGIGDYRDTAVRSFSIEKLL